MGALALLCLTLIACTTTGGATPSEPPIASATPKPTPAYLKPLVGFRYQPVDQKSGVDFKGRLETNAATKDAVLGYAITSLTFNGEPLNVTIELFDIAALYAGRSHAQDDLVAAATGRSDSWTVGLGARPVSYFNVSSFTSFLWLQGTSFVVVSADPVGVEKAAKVAEMLIDANSTESRFTISGLLSAANGNPVPDVTVWIVSDDYSCCTNVVPEVYTSSTGRFEFRVPEGDYRLLFYPAGIPGYGASWYRTAGDYESSQVIHVTRNTSIQDGQLVPGHAISGRVMSADRPAVGAHVDVYSAATGGWVMGTNVNENGRWLLRVAPGRYRLEFFPPDGTDGKTKWWRTGDGIQSSEVLIVGDQDVKDLDMTLQVGSS